MKDRIQFFTRHACRIILGLVFVFSGFVKAIDPLGTQYKIEDYLQAFGPMFAFFKSASLLIAFLLIAIEFTLGVLLITKQIPKITLLLTLIFYSVMLPLTLYIAITNPVSDCGCFGDALVLTNWQTFYKNLIFISLTILGLILSCRTAYTAPIIPALLTVFSSFCLLSGFMFWTVKHLPVIDFRPYKIGNNIPALMEFPADAPHDRYDITFIYEKDGKRQTFTLDNYPKNDSAWKFVDQQSVLIQKGYEPPIHDFELLNLDFEDLTFDILDNPDPVTLVIMYSLEKTDRKQLMKVTQLYHTCLQNRHPFYIITGAGPAQIEDFCHSVNSDSPSNELTPFNHFRQTFLMCDPVTLKTIVRANPGVIVVKQGNIIDKYNINNK